MPRQARKKSKSNIYHIILRGANRQEIFHDDEDCFKFLDILQRYKQKVQISVYAWCLMNNHIHLLVKEGNESISITMKRIGVSFVKYYNWKYRTIGHLFQDRFKSENVETDQYLVTVVRYIHQNPLKAGIVKRLEEWRWSSYLGYYDKYVYPDGLLDQHFVLRIFSIDPQVAKQLFHDFNEKISTDVCLEDDCRENRRLTDDEARQLLIKKLGTIEITQVKTLPRLQRNELLRKVKRIDGLSQRQVARILGISPNLIFKA